MLGTIEINEQSYEIRKPKIKDIKGLDLDTTEGVFELAKRCITSLSPNEINELDLEYLFDAVKLVREYLEKKL